MLAKAQAAPEGPENYSWGSPEYQPLNTGKLPLAVTLRASSVSLSSEGTAGYFFGENRSLHTRLLDYMLEGFIPVVFRSGTFQVHEEAHWH